MIFKRTLLAAAAAAAVGVLVAASGANAATNLIYNGDFELGDTGFGSDYAPAGNIMDPAIYEVATSTNVHPYWTPPYGDHTTGQGQMMIINGDDKVAKRAWMNNAINYTAGQSYTFTFYVASSYSTAPGNLSLALGSDIVGGPFDASSTVGEWTKYVKTFEATSSGVQTLALWNNQTAYTGNDFTLDDLSLTAVPEAATWAMMIVGFFGVGTALRSRRGALAAA